jgi:hypothetical protein
MNPQSETIERRKHFIPPLMMKWRRLSLSILEVKSAALARQYWQR